MPLSILRPSSPPVVVAQPNKRPATVVLCWSDGELFDRNFDWRGPNWKKFGDGFM